MMIGGNGHQMPMGGRPPMGMDPMMGGLPQMPPHPGMKQHPHMMGKDMRMKKPPTDAMMAMRGKMPDKIKKDYNMKSPASKKNKDVLQVKILVVQHRYRKHDQNVAANDEVQNNLYSKDQPNPDENEDEKNPENDKSEEEAKEGEEEAKQENGDEEEDVEERGEENHEEYEPSDHEG